MKIKEIMLILNSLNKTENRLVRSLKKEQRKNNKNLLVMVSLQKALDYTYAAMKVLLNIKPEKEEEQC